MRQQRHRMQARGGLSLVEVVISTMLVGMLLASAMNCVAVVVRGRFRVSDAIQAEQLLDQLLSEIMEQEYEEPDDPPDFGRESSESGGDRVDWDDVDDYHSWSANPPQDRSGAALPNSSNWQRDVSVEWVDPADPATTVGSDLGAKRIAVTIRHNGQVVAEGYAIRSNRYGEN